MNVRTSVGGLALFALLGCWGPRYARKSEQARTPAPKAGVATVVFVRPSGEARGIRYTVVGEQGTFLGELTASSWLATEVPPGAHLFAVWDDDNTNAGGATWGLLNEAIFNGGNPYVEAIAADLAAGKLYFVEVSVGFSGPHVRAVSPRSTDWARVTGAVSASTELIPTPEGQQNLDREQPDLARHLGQAAALAGKARPEDGHVLSADDGI